MSVKRTKKQPERRKTGLEEMYAAGKDIPYSSWVVRLMDSDYAREALGLVWQADRRRFILTRCGDCVGMDGSVFEPAGPLSLAHPAELDAPEILYWRRRVREEGLAQPFRQMEEPIVLKDGCLPGTYRAVESAGTLYAMTDRYEGLQLPLSALPALKKAGYSFVTRRRWDEDLHRMAEIELVNLVTPAGVFYGCRPAGTIDTLEADGPLCLILHLFYPFPGVRMRTLNYTAAALEDCLLPQFAARDALDMLLPHLPGMTVPQLKKLLPCCRKGSAARAMVTRVISRKEGEAC